MSSAFLELSCIRLYADTLTLCSDRKTHILHPDQRETEKHIAYIQIRQKQKTKHRVHPDQTEAEKHSLHPDQTDTGKHIAYIQIRHK